MADRAARLAWFKSIVLPHEAALRRHVRRLAAHNFDTDDIVSEVLTRAYATAEFERIDRGRGFLFAIARNLLTDMARRQSVISFDLMANLELLDVADDAPSTEAVVSSRDELRRLQLFVDSLPLQCRRVFLLRRVEELSPGEIADQLQLSVSTVEKHLAKAMALLTAAMADCDLVASAKGFSWGRKRKI